MDWEWPQWLMAILIGIEVLLLLFLDGETHNTTVKAGPRIINRIIIVVILYYGGFWG